MSLEDPFLIVQKYLLFVFFSNRSHMINCFLWTFFLLSEVFDALHKLRNNFTRWTELQSNPSQLSREDYSAFVTELKNGLKSIQWDLDELEESLGMFGPIDYISMD